MTQKLLSFYTFTLYIQQEYVHKTHPERPATIWHLWSVPEKFVCTHGKDHLMMRKTDLSPCTQQTAVSCWVSRPREKTIFQWYMLCCACFSIIVCTIDCIYVGSKIVRTWFVTVSQRNSAFIREKIKRERDECHEEMLDRDMS